MQFYSRERDNIVLFNKTFFTLAVLKLIRLYACALESVREREREKQKINVESTAKNNSLIMVYK